LDFDDLVSDFFGEELVVYYSNPSDKYELDAPYVFGFNEDIPVELGFQPEHQLFEIGVKYSNYWRILVNEKGENELVFETYVFPSCRVRVRQAFEWDGTHFVEKWLNFHVEPDTDNLNFCEFCVEHAINYWGPDAAIQIMEPILPFWPPEKDLEGNAYPLDARDEWIYRLGVYYALIGDYDKSIDYLSEIVQNPSNSLSRWIEPAEDFLLKYQEPEDVYKACINAKFCNPDYALDTLIKSLSVQEFNDVMQILWDNQVNILSSGYFDFDKDGTKERWIVVRHRPLEAMKFWILAADKTGGKGLNVGEVMNIPPTIEYLDRAFIEENDVSSEPIIFIDSKIAFQMKRMGIGSEAYVIYIPLRKEYPDKFALGLAHAENTLFTGEIEEANKQLLGLQEYPGLLCENTWSCDRYYYLLGLSEELLEDENQALLAYVVLWRNYSKSQFTVMGRLKIEGGIPPTATLTNTPTLNITATSGITLTPIPSTTISVTPTSATAYPPPNPTSIISPTPYPSSH
jgi:tetratricopeptide (TPR) repeat protein